MDSKEKISYKICGFAVNIHETLQILYDFMVYSLILAGCLTHCHLR